MKKILTILAAVGLTASASTAVVSCTHKKVSVPTFSTIRDINADNWKTTNEIKTFISNSSNPSEEDIEQIKSPKDFAQEVLKSNKKELFASAAVDFKNSEEAFKMMNEGNGKYSSFDFVLNNDWEYNTKKTFATGTLKFHTKLNNERDIYSESVKVKVLVGDGYSYLKDDDSLDYKNIDIASDENMNLFRDLMILVNDNRNIKNTVPENEIEAFARSSAMLKIDNEFLNIFERETQEAKKMVGFYESNGATLRYTSLNEQIKKRVYGEDNKNIIETNIFLIKNIIGTEFNNALDKNNFDPKEVFGEQDGKIYFGTDQHKSSLTFINSYLSENKNKNGMEN